VIVYAVIDDALSPDFPLDDALELFVRREHGSLSMLSSSIPPDLRRRLRERQTRSMSATHWRLFVRREDAVARHWRSRYSHFAPLVRAPALVASVRNTPTGR